MSYVYLSLLGLPWLAFWFVVYAFAEKRDWRALEILSEVMGGPVDILMNYTWLALFTWDIPQRGEYTFSTRLERLVMQEGAIGSISRSVAHAINWVLPGHIRGIF